MDKNDGGEAGIRTLGTPKGTRALQARALVHYATSPCKNINYFCRELSIGLGVAIIARMIKAKYTICKIIPDIENQSLCIISNVTIGDKA